MSNITNHLLKSFRYFPLICHKKCKIDSKSDENRDFVGIQAMVCLRLPFTSLIVDHLFSSIMDVLSALWSKSLSIRSAEEPSVFDSIPNEVLTKILDLLDPRSRVRAESVCYRWLSSVESLLATKNCLIIEDQRQRPPKYGDYKPFELRVDQKTDSIELKDFFSLRVIDLYTNHRYCNILSGIISNYANLKKLYICLMICPLKRNLLKHIARNLNSPELRHLTVICDDAELVVTRAECEALGAKFPKITVFQLEVFSLMIKEKTIEGLLQNWPQIEVFILMSLLSNSERKTDVETYTGQAFKYLNPNVKVSIRCY